MLITGQALLDANVDCVAMLMTGPVSPVILDVCEWLFRAACDWASDTQRE